MFDGGAITSDGGGMLLKKLEQRIGILKSIAQAFTDHRVRRQPLQEGHGVHRNVAGLAGRRVIRLKAMHSFPTELGGNF